jgi:hypothetical protein
MFRNWKDFMFAKQYTWAQKYTYFKSIKFKKYILQKFKFLAKNEVLKNLLNLPIQNRFYHTNFKVKNTYKNYHVFQPDQ